MRRAGRLRGCEPDRAGAGTGARLPSRHPERHRISWEKNSVTHALDGNPMRQDQGMNTDLSGVFQEGLKRSENG